MKTTLEFIAAHDFEGADDFVIARIAEVLVQKAKEALAQLEQEPVAFYNPQNGGFYWAKPTTIHAPQAVDIVPLALYTSPPQRKWVGLTDKEFKQIMLDTYNIDLSVPGHSSDDHMLWSAIEAKLKEKNND